MYVCRVMSLFTNNATASEQTIKRTHILLVRAS